jgi:hypothetical protein
MDGMDSFRPTPRTTLKRLPKRGVYDREAVYAILDEGFICHVAFVADGAPVLVPTAYGRDGDRLLLHGSAGSRMLRALAGGSEACIGITIVDALVLARSAFHHSINYRSVILIGRASVITETAAKLHALECISNHLVPGRWAEVRAPTAKELAATLVVEIPLEEVSAKVRTGPPLDNEADYELAVWAGMLPLSIQVEPPVDDGRVQKGVSLSASVADALRGRRNTRQGSTATEE